MTNLEYLKTFRENRKIKQKDFALAIGCPQSTYHYVEVGRTDLTCKQLKKLKEVFTDFDVFYFLGLDNPYQAENEELKFKLKIANDEKELAVKEALEVEKEFDGIRAEMTKYKDMVLELYTYKFDKERKEERGKSY